MISAGTVFAGYTIDRQLGQGGMGSVFLARHPRLNRQIALKVLNPERFADTEIRARFEREADLVARLEHPNIVTVYDRGVDDERLWISMQFVDGVDAAALAHPVPVETALHVIEGTAAALDHAHRAGVLHRDVKPANILLADTGGRGRVLLADFGIARPREDALHLTRTGTFTATLDFAAPEQLTGSELDHRTDQYALAGTLYALLTGRTPYESDNPAQIIQGHLRSTPPSLRAHRPELPAALDTVLARALAKHPTERFDSCAEFATAARRAVRQPADGGPTAAVPSVPANRASSSPAPYPVPPLGQPAPVAVQPSAPRRALGVLAGQSSTPQREPGVLVGQSSAPPEPLGVAAGQSAAPQRGSGASVGQSAAPRRASGVPAGRSSGPQGPGSPVARSGTPRRSSEFPAAQPRPTWEPAPAQHVPSRSFRGWLIAVGLVLVIVLGAGIWVWSDDAGFLALRPGSSGGYRDLNALAVGFSGVVGAVPV
ncbi:serine/threonine-protein kinase [Nocardia sp. SSK8]|uniref:serine/threonine-protein kinase n=1 Tax=Nocardia sp. SSK8 TaxID=3120154 RepID=UPI003008FA0A